MKALWQKRVVITGASSGIGREMARAFAAGGAEVFLTWRRSRQAMEALRDELQEAGARVHIQSLDISDTAAVRQCLEQARRTLGQVDILVNNAGADILTGVAAGQGDDEKLQILLDVDLRGTIHACRVVRELMQGQGVILNMAWDLALCGLSGRNAGMFAAAKAGIIGYSRSLARSAGPGLRVNVLAPGWIRTRFAEQDMDQDYYRARLAEIPLGRFGDPGEVAACAVFLCSPGASYITGAVLHINGGGHLAWQTHPVD